MCRRLQHQKQEYIDCKCGELSGNNRPTVAGGRGGYAVGDVNLQKGDTLYIYVGGQPDGWEGGFNGGGAGNISANATASGGGGATDIRIGTDSLFSRVIVAGRRWRR